MLVAFRFVSFILFFFLLLYYYRDRFIRIRESVFYFSLLFFFLIQFDNVSFFLCFEPFPLVSFAYFVHP